MLIKTASYTSVMGLMLLSSGLARAGEIGGGAGGFHFVVRGAASPGVYSPPVVEPFPGVEARDFVFVPFSLGLGLEVELGARATPTLALTGLFQADLSFVPSVAGDEPPSEGINFGMGFAAGVRGRVGPPQGDQYWFLDGGTMMRIYQGATTDDLNGYGGAFLDQGYWGGFVGAGLGFPKSWGETRLRASVGVLTGEDTWVFPLTIELHFGWGGG